MWVSSLLLAPVFVNEVRKKWEISIGDERENTEEVNKVKYSPLFEDKMIVDIEKPR